MYPLFSLAPANPRRSKLPHLSYPSWWSLAGCKYPVPAAGYSDDPSRTCIAPGMSSLCTLPISRFASPLILFPFSDHRFDACRRPLPSSSLCCSSTFSSSTLSQSNPYLRCSEYVLVQRRKVQLHGGPHVDYTIFCHCSGLCVNGALSHLLELTTICLTVWVS